MYNYPPTTRLAVLLAVSSLALLSRAADYPTTVTSLSPVAYYRFSETQPIIGNTATNHGTAGALGNGVYVNDDLTGVAPIHGVTPGALVASTNPCITATGTAPPNNSFMQVPFNNAINPTGPFTAEAWIQPASAPAGLTCFMSYGHIENPGNAPNRSGWLLYQDNGSSSSGGGLNFRMYNHNGLNRALTLTGGDVPNPGTWYHVAVAYDGTNTFLYFNGNLVASGEAAGFVPALDGNFSVGTRGDNSFQYSGLVDEVALYTNALPASVVLSHYQNGTSANPTTPYENLIASSNPLLYFRFDEPPVTAPATLTTTKNLGTGGSALDAYVDVGMTFGQAGVTYPGFGSTNIAPYFNGLLGDIIISNPPASLNNGSVTFTAWIKRQGPADSSQGAFGGGWAGIVFQRGGSGTATGLSFGDYNDLHYNWADNAAAYNYVPAPRMVIPDEVWSFVAGVFTPNQTILCLNGTFATNVVANATVDFTTQPIFIGQDPNSAFRFVQGYIDEVALFDKALTPAQLLQLFNSGGMTPIITVQPQAPTGTVYEGFDVSFNVEAIGGQPLGYQWTKNGTNVTGQTGTSLSFTNVHASDSGNYAAVVTNAFGSVTSSVVSLTVVAGPPILTAVPASISRYPGGTADFQVSAVGTTPITYQWYAGSNAIAGATSPTLQINQVQASDIGTYSVLVSNPHGNTNVSATLTLASLSTAPPYVNAVLTRNPIAFWRLNETNGSTAFDFQGGLDGTFNPLTTHAGSPGPVPPGFPGFEAANTSFSFDGNTSDVAAPPLNVNNNAATVVVMMQPLGLPPTDFYGIVFERNGSDVSGLNFRTGGDLGYTWNNDANSYNWDSGLLPLTNQWNFVALVVEPTQATIYLDTGKGMTSAVNTNAHGTAAWAAPTHLGTDPLGNRIYQGLLDEVAVFNYALSSTEIQALHDAAFKGTFTALPPAVVVQPISQGLLQGDSYTLSAQATGSEPLTYQWTKDNQPISSAIRDSLTISGATFADAGTYRWVVTQGSTSVTSAPAVITVSAIPTGVNLTNDLVLHLKFDGDFNDSSGRGNNGVAVGSPTFITGKLGKGAHLNSTGSTGGNYLSIPDNSGDFNFDVTNNFSVALWLRYTTDFNDLPVIGNAINSTYQKGWVITEDHNQFEWTLTGNDVGQILADPVGGPTINDGNWHNLVMVVDRDNVAARSYLDGTQIDLRSIAGLGTLVTGTTLTLCQDPSGAYGVSGAFDLDDVGIWQRALTRVEAESIYFAGQNGNSFDSVVTNLPPVTMSIQYSAGSVVIKWPNGTLESSTNAGSGYLPVQGAAAPSYTVPLPLEAARYYRVKVQ